MPSGRSTNNADNAHQRRPYMFSSKTTSEKFIEELEGLLTTGQLTDDNDRDTEASDISEFSSASNVSDKPKHSHPVNRMIKGGLNAIGLRKKGASKNDTHNQNGHLDLFNDVIYAAKSKSDLEGFLNFCYESVNGKELLSELLLYCKNDTALEHLIDTIVKSRNITDFISGDTDGTFNVSLATHAASNGLKDSLGLLLSNKNIVLKTDKIIDKEEAASFYVNKLIGDTTKDNIETLKAIIEKARPELLFNTHSFKDQGNRIKNKISPATVIITKIIDLDCKTDEKELLIDALLKRSRDQGPHREKTSLNRDAIDYFMRKLKDKDDKEVFLALIGSNKTYGQTRVSNLFDCAPCTPLYHAVNYNCENAMDLHLQNSSFKDKQTAYWRLDWTKIVVFGLMFYLIYSQVPFMLKLDIFFTIPLTFVLAGVATVLVFGAWFAIRESLGLSSCTSKLHCYLYPQAFTGSYDPTQSKTLADGLEASDNLGTHPQPVIHDDGTANHNPNAAATNSR